MDGKRAKPNLRLSPGQTVRVPPAPDTPAESWAPEISGAEARWIRETVIYQDSAFLVINKPAGLAVQGGHKVRRSLDDLLEALRFDGAEKPRLVHRLDRETSGVLVLARTAKAATFLTGAFRERTAEKIYLALLAGVPPDEEGTIDVPLGVQRRGGREKVIADGPDGKTASTAYCVLQRTETAALVECRPATGRKHQIRAHCAHLGCPVAGDGRYGGKAAFLSSLPENQRLKLHAFRLTVPHPDGGKKTFSAPVAAHIRASLDFLGLQCPVD